MCRDAAAAEGQATPTFVVGNESADADSIICALVIAFLLHVADPLTNYLPVVRCREEDIVMRGAVLLLLDEAGIDPAGLIYLPRSGGAPELSAAVERGPTILTDHNVPAESVTSGCCCPSHSERSTEISMRVWLAAL